jgi:hypothetical protein
MESTLTKAAPVKTEAKTEEKPEFKLIKIKRYKLIELAAIYEVNRKTFRGWLTKFKTDLGEREGHYYSIAQVKFIFSKLELPSYVKVYLD